MTEIKWPPREEVMKRFAYKCEWLNLRIGGRHPIWYSWEGDEIRMQYPQSPGNAPNSERSHNSDGDAE